MTLYAYDLDGVSVEDIKEKFDAEKASLTGAHNALSDASIELELERLGQLNVLFTEKSALITAGKFEKRISIEDFYLLLGRQITKTTESDGKSFSLPVGCVVFEQKFKKIRLVCFYPETIKEVTYKNGDGSNVTTKAYKIPFPNLLIQVTLKEQDNGDWLGDPPLYYVSSEPLSRIIDSVKTNSVSPQLDNIFIVPFTNFYDNGTMCYGTSNYFSRFSNNDLRGINYYYQVIFDSAFNNHLGIHNINFKGGMKDLLTHLSTLETFPYHLLLRKVRR